MGPTLRNALMDGQCPESGGTAGCAERSRCAGSCWQSLLPQEQRLACWPPGDCPVDVALFRLQEWPCGPARSASAHILDVRQGFVQMGEQQQPEDLRCACCSVSVSVALFPRATQPPLGRGCLPEPRSAEVPHVDPECSPSSARGRERCPAAPYPPRPGLPHPSLRWEGEALEVRPGLSPSYWRSGDPSAAQALWAPCSPPTVQTHRRA